MIKFYNQKSMIRKRIYPKSTLTLATLRAFLMKNEPKLVRMLVNTWNAQGKAITYEELRQAILDGVLSPNLFLEWQQDYAKFTEKRLEPLLEEAIVVGVTPIENRFSGFRIDLSRKGISDWMRENSARFVKDSTQAQIDGLNSVIRFTMTIEDYSVDELAKVVRPMVGLTEKQAVANMRYYDTLRKNGMDHDYSLDKAIQYAERQHRSRASTISRTEMVSAYNAGEWHGAQQAQQLGLMGRCVKRWSTAFDERVCPVCGDMDGQEVDMNDEFLYSGAPIGIYPPAHPNCRCSYEIIEVEPPQIEYIDMEG